MAALNGGATAFNGGLPQALPRIGFSGVVPPGGFLAAPNVGRSAFLVTDAVVNLRRAYEATGGFESREGEEAGGTDVQDGGGEPPDHYGALEVARGAKDGVIKKSYQRLVDKWHPDKHPKKREAADEMIRAVNKAYEILSNPLKRSGFDQLLEALERKKKHVRLDNSMVQPRHAIPKEFMLCPVGHPDKFVRSVGCELKVQSREDTNENFKEFFGKAHFALWWTEEIRNMCRLRTAETSAAGIEIGMAMNFLMEGTPKVTGKICAKDADLEMRSSEDPRYVNVIAVASPFSPGAFRLECAFWPGHYMTFREPSKLCMGGLVDEVKDCTDFYLVDPSFAFKTLSVSEALAVPAQAQGRGDYVKLGDLKADINVRAFFQNVLACPVWGNREFETFFEAHYEEWDLDRKRSRVRPRPMAELFANRLCRAKHQSETAKEILGAGDELGALPLDAVERVLLGPAGLAAEGGSGAASKEDLLASQRRLLGAVPALCAHAGDATALHSVLALRRAVLAVVTAAAEQEAELLELREAAAAHLVSLAQSRLMRAPQEITCDVLIELLDMPLDWSLIDKLACDAIAPALAESRPVGAFLDLLRKALKTGKAAKTIAEAVAKRELKALGVEQGPVVAEVLTVVATSGILAEEVEAALKPPLLQRLPLAHVVLLLGLLAERTLPDAIVRRALESRLQTATASSLREVPVEDLLRLAEASSKSACVAELALGPIVRTATTAVYEWPPESMSRLLLLAARRLRSGGSLPAASEFFAEAVCALPVRLQALGLEEVLAVLSWVPVDHCGALLEDSTVQALSRFPDLEPLQLLKLTEWVLPLGKDSRSVVSVFERWVRVLSVVAADSASQRMSADDLVRLMVAVARVSPDKDTTESILNAVGAQLQTCASNLSAAGRKSLAAAFPEGGGLSFAGKEKVLAMATMDVVSIDSKASKSRSRSPLQRAIGGERANMTNADVRRRSSEAEVWHTRAAAANSRSRSRERPRGNEYAARNGASARDKPQGRGESRSRSREPPRSKGRREASESRGRMHSDARSARSSSRVQVRAHAGAREQRPSRGQSQERRGYSGAQHRGRSDSRPRVERGRR